MKWKTAWNRPTSYLFILVGIAVAVFGFIAGQQRSLLIVFLLVAVIYLVAGVLFLFLAWKGE
jgi:hypothetical protein